MQIVIDIPKEVFEEIQVKFLNTKVNKISVTDRAIYNGTPLDDVKKEIADIETYERDGCWVMADVWKVLNDIGKESEDKLNG